jgi:hypothetical protein
MFSLLEFLILIFAVYVILYALKKFILAYSKDNVKTKKSLNDFDEKIKEASNDLNEIKNSADEDSLKAKEVLKETERTKTEIDKRKNIKL